MFGLRIQVHRPSWLFALTIAACAPGIALADPLRHGTESFTEPYASIDVAASEPGRLTAVHVRRGDRVAAGQLLMELDASVLEASRRVAAQRAAATARIEALRVDFEQKQRRYDTLTGLRRDGAASAEELQAAEAEMRIAMHQRQAAEEELERSRLELAEIEARIEQRRVRAPLAGVITDVRHEAGEFVPASEPQVATLVDLTRLRITFHLPTSQAARLQSGDRLSIVPAMTEAAANSEPMIGTIEHIAPLTQADSGRVRVDVMIENPDGRHRSGVRCTLELGAQSPPVRREASLAR